MWGMTKLKVALKRAESFPPRSDHRRSILSTGNGPSFLSTWPRNPGIERRVVARQSSG